MPVSVVRRCKIAGVRVADVAAAARRILLALGEADAELTISLVNDAQIRRLNGAYRGKDRPTDVLAFAMREGRRAPGDNALLGDVVISVETAARQAEGRGAPIAQEVRILLIHAVLHLLGYDHERSVEEARDMRAMEHRLQKLLPE